MVDATSPAASSRWFPGPDERSRPAIRQVSRPSGPPRSVEQEAEQDVGEPGLEAFKRPAGLSDEPDVGVSSEHRQRVGDCGFVVAQAARLAAQRDGDLVDAIVALLLE